MLIKLLTQLQCELFPELEEHFLEKLSDTDKDFLKIIELFRPYLFSACLENSHGPGRPGYSRLSLLLAFIAKSVYGISTNHLLVYYLKADQLMRKLCGFDQRWEIPSEATFSRAFAEIAQSNIMQTLLEELVVEQLGGEFIFHISRDSTAIEAREKPVKKAHDDEAHKPKGKRGRPRKGQERPKEKTRIEKQQHRNLEENLNDLPPVCCDRGTKRNAKGHTTSWNGYKLHLDVVDGDIVVSAHLSSASLHDSQLAIPLSQITGQRINSCYELMDSAYDAQPIHEFIKQQGRIPIIDPNPRRMKIPIVLDDDRKQRFKHRSSVERVNGTLKDRFLGRTIWVRGAS